MRIENLRRHRLGDRTRIEASYVYEDTNLPPVDIFYEAGPPLGGALEATPEAFVLSGYPIALWEGERRLKVEGALDRKLANGLEKAGALLSSWYGRCDSLVVEPTAGFRDLTPPQGPNAVSLFSGGADACAMVCENRRTFPLDHPESIRSVVYAFGFSFLDRETGEEDTLMRARYDAQAARIQAFAKRVDLEVILLDTNVRLLDHQREPFYYAAHSGAFLAPLVAAPEYVSDALIASAGEGGAVQIPHGSHPILDELYSTGAVRIRHVQPQITRSQKLRMLSDWEPAFDMLQVCHGFRVDSPEQVNCGRCEKCIRTMVGLIVWDALPRFRTFPVDDVTPEMIEGVEILAKYDYLTLPEVLTGLERAGRMDLVQAIRARAERLPVRRASSGHTERWRRVLERMRRHLRIRRV